MQKKTTTTLEFDDYIITYDHGLESTKLLRAFRILGAAGLSLFSKYLPKYTLANFEIKSIKSKEQIKHHHLKTGELFFS